jgi:hypothetical protein
MAIHQPRKRAEKFDKGLLTQCVEAWTVEWRKNRGDETPTNLSAFYKQIASQYNKRRPTGAKAITEGQVRSRIIEWGIPIIVTAGKKAGEKVDPVNRSLLIECVEEWVETWKANHDANDHPTQQALKDGVATMYNSRKSAVEQTISPVVVRLRVGEWNITHNTVPQIKPINRGGGKLPKS